MAGSNDSSNNDGSVDSSTEGDSDEDIPAHPGRSSKYNRQHDTSSPAARRASKMKHASIADNGPRQSQRWLAPSTRDEVSPPSGQRAASVEKHDDCISDNAFKAENVSSIDPGMYSYLGGAKSIWGAITLIPHSQVLRKTYAETSLEGHDQKKVF